MNIHENSRYHEVHARSLRDPEGFWAEVAREIDWIEPAKKIFDPSIGLYGRWFTGAVVNTCYNALDRHVAGGRADPRAGQHCNDGFRHHRHIEDDAVAFGDAEIGHDGGERLHLLQQLGIGKFRDRAGERRIVDQRHLIGAAAGDMAIERVVAGVDHGAGEPAAV